MTIFALGECREHWKLVALQDLCTFRHGGTPSKANADYWKGTIPWISPKDMGTDSVANAQDRITIDAVKNSSASLVPADTVLVVVRSGILARRFPVAVIEDHVTFNQDIKAILPDPEKLNSEFLRYVLKFLEGKVIDEGVKRGATVHSIRSGFIESLEIPLPSLPEQQRIAQALKTKLAAVEQARRASVARLEAVRTLPAAYLRELFESEEALEWPEFSLGDLARIVQNGIYKKAEFYGSGEPFIRMYNVDNATWRLNQNALASVVLADDEKEKFRLDARDLLVSRVNSYEQIGKSAIVSNAEEGYFFENMLIRLRLVPEADPLFMVQQLATRGVRDALRGVAKRAIGQVSVNSSDLRNLKVRLPDIKRQRDIALMLDARIDSATSLRALVSEELSGLGDIPCALLRQAFSGAL